MLEYSFGLPGAIAGHTKSVAWLTIFTSYFPPNPFSLPAPPAAPMNLIKVIVVLFFVVFVCIENNCLYSFLINWKKKSFFFGGGDSIIELNSVHIEGVL